MKISVGLVKNDEGQRSCNRYVNRDFYGKHDPAESFQFLV